MLGIKVNKREVGSKYEKTVGEYLKGQKFKIIEYNFHCRFGEIDIIAQDENYLVFIEVKYRQSEKSGNPLEAVTPKKQKTISKVAAYYCLTHGYVEDTPCRFDVAAVLGEEILLIKDAFEYQG